MMSSVEHYYYGDLMMDALFKGKGRFLVSRAVGAAVVIFIIGLVSGLMTDAYWFIGVFVLSNVLMLLGDLVKHMANKP